MSSVPTNLALAAVLILVTIAAFVMLAVAQVVEPLQEVLTMAGALAAALVRASFRAAKPCQAAFGC